MKNYLVKAITKDGMFRAYAVDATNVVAEAQQRHDTWSAASAALGRSLVGTLMLASSVLKGDDKLTVKINGDGPVGGIVVDGNAHGTVKGYLQHPHVHLPLNDQGKIDVKGAVGTAGTLSVTKDMGLEKPFTGQVPLVSGELGEDFTYYLAQSEQIPSAVGVSVFVNPDNSIEVAGGFLIQVLPGATDEAIDKLQNTIQSMPMVSEQLRQGKKPEAILTDVFGDEQLDFLEQLPVKFECDCSKDRFAAALAAIAPGDLQQMIEEDHGAEAVCHFCGRHYQYSEADLLAIQAGNFGDEG